MAQISARSDMESKIHSALSDIDQYKSIQQMRNLCLLASPIVPYTQLYDLQSIYDVYNKLKESYSYVKALAILIKMMEFARFSSERLARLSSLLSDKSEEVSLDFSYQRLLVFIADNLGNEEHLKKVVNGLTDKQRGTAADQVATSHALLYHMTNAGTIVHGNCDSISVLIEKFNAVGLTTLANKVCVKIRTIASGDGYDSDDNCKQIHANSRPVLHVHEEQRTYGTTVQAAGCHFHAIGDVDNESTSGSSNSEKSKLLASSHCSLSTESANNGGIPRDSCWISKITHCALCVLIVFTAIVVVLAALTTVGGYRLHVNTEPQRDELRIGDVVDCGQVNQLSEKGLNITKNATTADSGDHQVHLKSVSEKDLEALRKNRSETYSEDSFQVPTDSRFTIPRGPKPLPYTMSGSNISVSICLQSNVTYPSDAYIFIFDNHFAVVNFLDNETNATHDAVFPPYPLKVGAEGNKPQCHHKVYPVARSAYYRIALEVASGGVTIVSYNITLDVVYINGSSLTKLEQCVVDNEMSCSVGLSHKLLCYFPESTSSQCSTNVCTIYLIVETIPRFILSVMRIAGIVLFAVFIVLLMVLVCIVVYIRCVKHVLDTCTTTCNN